MEYLENFMAEPNNQMLVEQMNLHERLEKVKNQLNHVSSDDYLNELTEQLVPTLFRRD